MNLLTEVLLNDNMVEPHKIKNYGKIRKNRVCVFGNCRSGNYRILDCRNEK